MSSAEAFLSVAESRLVPSRGRVEEEEVEIERLRDFLGGELWEGTGCIRRPFSKQSSRQMIKIIKISKAGNAYTKNYKNTACIQF